MVLSKNSSLSGLNRPATSYSVLPSFTVKSISGGMRQSFLTGLFVSITELRKQLKLNKGIEERSIKIQEKTDLLYANEYRAKEAEQNRKSQRKERDAR